MDTLDDGAEKSLLAMQRDALESIRKSRLDPLVAKRIERRDAAAAEYRRAIEIFSETGTVKSNDDGK